MNNINTIEENWRSVRQRIQKAQQSSAAALEVCFIAVSKAQPAEVIVPLLQSGHRAYGENRVQEARAKWPVLKAQYPQTQLHLIGSLQTNKVKEALALFNVIHTVDRPALADALVKEIKHSGAATHSFFMQVNTGEEPHKGGVMPRDARLLLDHCREGGLPIAGLMCVPPADDLPAPHFALLHQMAREFALPHLSMGMSGDFETAVRLGATHVRIGTALFGKRV